MKTTLDNAYPTLGQINQIRKFIKNNQKINFRLSGCASSGDADLNIPIGNGYQMVTLLSEIGRHGIALPNPDDMLKAYDSSTHKYLVLTSQE